MNISRNSDTPMISDSTDFISFFGIADVYGIDRYLKCTDLDKDSIKQEKAFCMMRAQMNRHRHAVYFECPDAPSLYVDMIDMLLKDEKYEDALSIVKSCPLQIPYDCKNSWDMIPNPKLDPYYDPESQEPEAVVVDHGSLKN
tara:strand:+ start:875 stop:1300 length:426 start_codon:yes stop_codon:yes gene_type:complete